MKLAVKLLAIVFVLATATALAARQTPEKKENQNAIEKLARITLAASGGDSINVGEEIGKNQYTLIVMYRGVW
ncbi:MAG: hypothetical protein ACE5I1_06220 [bacterium]